VPVEVRRDGKHLMLTASIQELKDKQIASAAGSGAPGSSWGLTVQDLTPEIAQQLGIQNSKGVVIRNVRPDSPGAEAGLQPGDVILEVDNSKVGSSDDFAAAAKGAQKDKKSARLLVQRGNSTIYTVINAEG
jgi:serine protease Do